jgi:hypothetical protein
MIRLTRVIPSGATDLTLVHLIIRGRLCDGGKCVRSPSPRMPSGLRMTKREHAGYDLD